MDDMTYLVSLVRTMVQEVISSLRTVHGKQQRQRPHLCYVCQHKGHIACSCLLQNKDSIEVENTALRKRLRAITNNKATIRFSLYSNVMSLTWKHMNQYDEIIGYVPGIKVNIDGVEVVQKFI
ncbi:5585_t:CDS:2 [Gigaspora margarita]|uniref:5585_t:CDS:1 n=1 Tax=Gigaspora margarita TaxID=4874 RepID=A0ABN7URJ4_GIGMA|nr:5585_t:CDS:2 [Gigaspora margarita]